MWEDWQNDPENCIYPEEIEILQFDNELELIIWEIFEPIWLDIRSSMSPSVLRSVLSYCELFKIDSIYDREDILEIVRVCLPEQKQREK